MSAAKVWVLFQSNWSILKIAAVVHCSFLTQATAVFSMISVVFPRYFAGTFFLLDFMNDYVCSVTELPPRKKSVRGNQYENENSQELLMQTNIFEQNTELMQI